MPGYDGTGPRGRGPMTGRGGGFCILRISEASGEPVTGFAGISGRPVSASADKPRPDLMFLRTKVRHMEKRLGDIRRRVDALDTRRQTRA
jgi:hypothetical protein